MLPEVLLLLVLVAVVSGPLPQLTLLQQLSSLGMTLSVFSGSNCLLSGHANLMPGLVTGRTFLQVAACTDTDTGTAQHSTYNMGHMRHGCRTV